MATSKRRDENHLIDQDGEALLRSKLPRNWILRSYRPDYGLDFTVELFKQMPDGTEKRPLHETLGEHIFVQLKSTRSPEIGSLPVYGRYNVEKSPENLDRSEKIADIDTYRIEVETPELVTIERMGTAVPVLLVIADLTANRCSFVCLNDYIDKILIPRHQDYRSAGQRTIHVPVCNELGTDQGKIALRWYGKRPKLFSAFQRFVYQQHELQHSHSQDWRKLAYHFALRIADYDFWEDTEMCPPIAQHAGFLGNFIKTGQPGLMTGFEPPASFDTPDIQDWLKKADVYELWRRLALLPLIHEDIWREWFLPTGLGMMTALSQETL